MKSAHKLAAALAVLITLLVTSYFILMALQSAMSLSPNSVIIVTPKEKPDELSTTSASTEPITRPQVNQSRLVELTTTPAPTSAPKSVVRTLEVKPAPSDEHMEEEITKEPAVTSDSVHQEPSSTSVAAATTTTTSTTSPTTPSPASTGTTEPASASPASSESTPSQVPSSEQTPSTPPPTTTTAPIDSEKLYKEITTMPADGFQMAPEEESAWQEFKRQFGRSYQSAEEEKQRAEKFLGNLRFINAHNRMAQASFQLGVNQFADLTRDEINSKHIGPLINWTTTLDASGATKPPQMRILEEDQAASQGVQGVDWRNGTIQPPLDQGLCPESALFSVISSLEASLELAGFKGIRLSPRQLMDCLTYGAPQPPAWPPVCSGQLSMVTLWEFLQRQSIRLVPEVEYEQFRGAQMQGLAPPQTCIPPLPEGAREQRPKVLSYHQVPGEHFEVALQNRGPLVVALDASRPTFHFYKSGLYHELQCSSDSYNMHALLVASKPASSDGASGTPEHFTLRASLGVKWGESGHIHLLKDPTRNKCLPEQLATYPDLGFE